MAVIYSENLIIKKVIFGLSERENMILFNQAKGINFLALKIIQLSQRKMGNPTRFLRKHVAEPT